MTSPPTSRAPVDNQRCAVGQTPGPRACLVALAIAAVSGACSSSEGEGGGRANGGDTSASGGETSGAGGAGGATTASTGGGGTTSAAGASGTGGSTRGDAGGIDAIGGAGGAAAVICSACDGSCEAAVAVDSANHVEGDLGYGNVPPAGGDHNPCWANWGVHSSPLPAENWVHNLEHGGVVFLYACPSGCDADVAALAGYVEGRTQAILTEYPDMPDGFAVVSWGHRLVSTCLDMDAMSAFYDAHVDDAPESVTSGMPSGCP